MNLLQESAMRAIFFQEPVDQFACVERAWRSRLEQIGGGTIFLRSRPGEWCARPSTWSIKFVLEGCCEFEAEGLSCEVHAGFCFVIPAGMSYRSRIRGGRSLSLFGPAIADADIGGAEGVFGVFAMSETERQDLGDWLDGLRHARSPARTGMIPDQGREVRLDRRSPLPADYLEMLRRVRAWSVRGGARQRSLPRLLLARHYLTAHYRDHDVCSRAAGVASMTRSHFSRMFSRLFGVSPRRYVVGYRAAVATVLLGSGRYGVEQVAAWLGYGHSSSLAHLFQRQRIPCPRQVGAALRRDDSR